MISYTDYPVATSQGIKQLLYLDAQKQQQFNQAPVIKTPSPPSSPYTNTSNPASYIYTMDPTLPFPITEIQVHKPTPQPIIPTPIYNPLHHQQGVWTRDRIQQYYPLYLDLDNEIQSSSSFSATASASTSTPFEPLITKSPYQDVVNGLQQLTYSYNNSPYFHQKTTTTSNRNPFLNEFSSSSSNSTNSSVPLTQIYLPSYHGYSFNSKPTNLQANKPPILISITSKPQQLLISIITYSPKLSIITTTLSPTRLIITKDK